MRKLIYILLFAPLLLFSQNYPDVGDLTEGGIVFYIDPNGQYGLVVALNDIGQVPWGCDGIDINGADESFIGSGYQNTLDIINNCAENNIAARLCSDYISESYEDWYLPSIEELELIYNNVGQYSNYASITNFNDDWYQSSSEVNYSTNWVYGFNWYGAGYYIKSYSAKWAPYFVRPIRSFLISTSLGCSDSLALNYNYSATEDNGSCLYSADILQNAVSSIYEVLETWNTTIDLSAGWNMFGYGCPSSIDVAEGLSNQSESIIIVKDNNGVVYMPEFGFNGIGNFTPGFGYQIKLTDAIESFSLCDWYVNDIPEDNIVSLQEYIVQLEDSLELLNTLPTHQVGDYAEGGIVFYVDETGQHGLVAAIENLTEGTTDPNGFGFNVYEWGCSGEDVNGADGTSIGTGYQNTIDIINQGCSTDNGGITAAQSALDYESNGFDDWYLPSFDELQQMWHSIGPFGGSWSSTEKSSTSAYIVGGNFTIMTGGHSKTINNSVRPVRSF